MKIWNKPQVREQEVGLEVTSYCRPRSTSSNAVDFLRYRYGGRELGRRSFF